MKSLSRKFWALILTAAMVLILVPAGTATALSNSDCNGLWTVYTMFNGEEEVDTTESGISISMNFQLTGDGTGTITETIDGENDDMSVLWYPYEDDDIDGIMFMDSSDTWYLLFIDQNGMMYISDGNLTLVLTRDTSEDTYSGSECSNCGGTGSPYCSVCERTGLCGVCDGTGEIYYNFSSLGSGYTTCTLCNGSGKCSLCHGSCHYGHHCKQCGRDADSNY